MMLHVLKRPWRLRVDDCPCDVQFIDWLRDRDMGGRSIFHFGTGDHHHVGQVCAGPDLRNPVLGVTATPKEYDSFIKLAIRSPEVARYYAVQFADIYNLNPDLLPDFDIVTLFHLCEFRDEKNDGYGAMTDADLVRMFADRIKPGGHMLFYTGSYAWAKAEPILEAWSRDAAFDRMEDFKTLRLYRKR